MFPEESSRAEPRIADNDRDRVVAVLRMHCTEGRITLDEFSDRVGDVYNARTAVELDAVVSDLPVPWSEEAPPADDPSEAIGSRRGRAVRWLIAIFSSANRRGRFTLDDECVLVAAFGDATLDLSEASIEGPNPLVTAAAIFGNITVIVPEGIEVNLQGLPLFGSTRCDTGSAPPVPGSPIVTVRAFAVFGDVRVRLPRDRIGDRRFGRTRQR
ncbi:MAG TPA: DUF1707 domain-containing protein [Acidimicrobiales bacterium]|nr:DUF1707 domain-containing protein [Acidimicrobiales bacterium]